MKRDSIDWAAISVPVLFRKMFVPTLLGLLAVSSVNIVDGAFVGQGAGSDALAAVNIAAPLFLITTGIGLMFGAGASIVASIHLARGNKKAADINVSQAYGASFLLIAILAMAVIFAPLAVARLLGSSDILWPYVRDYMRWVVPVMPFIAVTCIGLFVIRLDGSPQFAMMCNAVPCVVNAVLDWFFIFPCRMGIEGASLATGLAHFLGFIMVLVYMLWFSRRVNLRLLKLSVKSLRLSLRNIGYQVKVGAPSMIGELAIACTMFVGNYMFIRHLGEDGVAAYSVVCYCFPLIFLVGNAISQAAQPIVSYNYGAGLHDRVRQTFRISLLVGILCGVLTLLCGICEAGKIIWLFIPDMASSAYAICREGFKYYSPSFLFITLNVVCIGYLQSLERTGPATAFMLLRGIVFVIPAFLCLPSLIGTKGLWLAIPLAELLTLVFIIVYAAAKVRRARLW